MCRRLIGEHNDVAVGKATGGHAPVVPEKTQEGVGLVISAHHEQELPGMVQNRVGQGHPPMVFVHAGDSYPGVGALEDRIGRYQRCCVAVGAKPEVDQVEHRWRSAERFEGACVTLRRRGYRVAKRTTANLPVF